MRHLSEDEAKALKPASEHYTAYVGPPDQYDFMGGTQFALLFLLGLREHHKVLDFGCGSLRAGRLLISYLKPGNYYGIEPNTWLIEDAFARQLGGMERLKSPHFSDSDSFQADVFGETFDLLLPRASSVTPDPLYEKGFGQARTCAETRVFARLRLARAMKTLRKGGFIRALLTGNRSIQAFAHLAGSRARQGSKQLDFRGSIPVCHGGYWAASCRRMMR